jgi:hypothetical protein
MSKLLYRLLDRFEEWLRYPQPTRLQKQLLGMHTDVIDTDFTAIRLASESSARYVIANMRTVPNFEVDYDYRDWIVRTQLSPNLAHGLIGECGVATGRTINHIARLCPVITIHGFDSFDGLPEDWTSRMPKGFFKRNSLPKVRKNVELHVGWFENTLPDFKTKYGNTPLQLLHIDSDLYSSAITILETLKDNIVPGTVIMFDEYLNYPGWELDEFKAWQEHVTKYNIKYEYIGRVSKHQKVAIRVLSKG